jgi:putative glutamine transport system permease protein
VTGEQTGGAYAPAYIVSGLLFFIICFPLSRAASMWENNIKSKERKVA